MTSTHARPELPALDEWKKQSLHDLIEHILASYHEPLEGDVDRVTALVERCLGDAGSRDRVAPVARVFADLVAELRAHFSKEEQVLFPWIRSGNGASAHGPVRVMHMEHDSASSALDRLRELTEGYAPGDESPGAERELLAALAEFDATLVRHMYLENEILFPRALAGEAP